MVRRARLSLIVVLDVVLALVVWGTWHTLAARWARTVLRSRPRWRAIAEIDYPCVLSE